MIGVEGWTAVEWSVTTSRRVEVRTVAKSHADLSNEAGEMSERKYWGRREVLEPRGNSYTEMSPDSDS